MVTSLPSKRLSRTAPDKPTRNAGRRAPSQDEHSTGTSGGSTTRTTRTSGSPTGRRSAGESPAPGFRAGTYNLAAGNETYSQSFDKSKRLAAEQIVSGEVNVMALQEVGVNGRNTRGRDNNEELLQEIFRQELPPDFEDADMDQVSLDAQGRPVMRDGRPVYDPETYPDTRYTATNREGESQTMTLSRDRYDDEGRPVPFGTSPEDAPTVIYSAHLDQQDKTYSIAYASNNKHGSYGNSVLLGPGYEIEDVEQQVLGHDPDDQEQRSALAVSFTTPDGHQATAISAHLTNGGSESQGDARVGQLESLSDWAEGFDNAVIMGDFNTAPGKAYGTSGWDFLPGIDPSHTPSASSLGLQDPDPDSGSIDRVFTQGDVTVGPRRELDGQGGSDHDLVTWDITLPEALRQTYALAS
jgi:endonuclease/exonuclease/phosphatase family metal-dependent hydrolase